MAAALKAAELGLDPVVLDEQPAPGGQIYRNVEGVAADRPADFALLGADYSAGLELVRGFRAAGLDYRPMTQVFEVRAGSFGVLGAGRAEILAVDETLIACGAMERPMPIRGWTLPGVMGAGAAQTLLKASDVVPDGPTVIAGSGPLVFLIAWQLARAGVELRAVIRTTPPGQYRKALRHLPGVALDPDLWKGLGWLAGLRRRRIAMIGGADMVAAEGEGRLEAVRYARKGRAARIEATNLLLHEGVVPNLQLSRAAGCAHDWDEAQRCWRPRVDAFGATTVEGLRVAGDCAGIGGAKAAACFGRIAALGAAERLGAIDAAERDRRAAPERQALARHLRIRPFLDMLFRPADAMVVPVNESTVVCRCEEVTAGELRRLAALGVPGPNQAKAFCRAGMGPCQGRLCGLTVSEILAEASGRPMAEVGYFRIRPPVKPISVGELASLAGDEG
jgi:NADPH-dependent 2,4-dienoyl-CoA reductase/sulfur reductase-like enzyme